MSIINTTLNSLLDTYLTVNSDNKTAILSTLATNQIYVDKNAHAIFSTQDSLTKDALNNIMTQLNWDLVEDMSRSFEGIRSNFIELNPICGNNVINMSETYRGCWNLKTSPVCGPNVVDMSYAYSGCWNLTGSPVIGDKVTNMHSVYNSCINLTGKPVISENVIDMSVAYQSCKNLKGDAVCGEFTTNMYCAYKDTNLHGEPACGNNVVDMSFAYYHANMKGSPKCSDSVTNMCFAYSFGLSSGYPPACGNNVIDMQEAYYSSGVSGKAVIGPNVQNAKLAYGETYIAEMCDIPEALTNSGAYGRHGADLVFYNTEIKNIHLGSQYATSPTQFNWFGVYTLSNADNIIIDENVTSMSGFANTCLVHYDFFTRNTWTNRKYYLEHFNIKKIPDNVISMSYAFDGCSSLEMEPIIGNNVTQMTNCYNGCSSLYGKVILPKNIKNMAGVYRGCGKLTGSPIVGDLVNNIDYSYCGCYSLTGSPVAGVNVTNMVMTYYNCRNLSGEAVCSSKVKNMYSTYSGCSNLTKGVCGPNVYDMTETYRDCTELITAEIGNNVTLLNNCFRGDYKLSGNIYINNTNVTDATRAFDLLNYNSEAVRDNYLNVFMQEYTPVWMNLNSITTGTIEQIDEHNYTCSEQKINFYALPNDVIEKVDATCTERGYVKFKYIGETTVREKEFPALGHDYDPVTGICKRCGQGKPDPSGYGQVEVTSSGRYSFTEVDNEWIANFNDDYEEIYTEWNIIDAATLEWTANNDYGDEFSIYINGNKRLDIYDSQSGIIRVKPGDTVSISMYINSEDSSFRLAFKGTYTPPILPTNVTINDSTSFEYYNDENGWVSEVYDLYEEASITFEVIDARYLNWETISPEYSYDYIAIYKNDTLTYETSDCNVSGSIKVKSGDIIEVRYMKNDMSKDYAKIYFSGQYTPPVYPTNVEIVNMSLFDYDNDESAWVSEATYYSGYGIIELNNISASQVEWTIDSDSSENYMYVYVNDEEVAYASGYESGTWAISEGDVVRVEYYNDTSEVQGEAIIRFN